MNLPGLAGSARLVVPETAVGSVILFPHRDGDDDFIGGVVGELCEQGFAVLVPDLFAGMATDLTPEQRKRSVVDDAVIALAQTCVARLRERLPGLPRPAALGFCMGGRLAFLAAAAMTGVGRACSFYGGELDRGWHSNLTPLDRVRPGIPPIQLHRGSRDTNATAAAQQAAVSAVDAVGGYLEAHTYTGARHAFANRLLPERFHPAVTRRAMELAASFLRTDREQE